MGFEEEDGLFEQPGWAEETHINPHDYSHDEKWRGGVSEETQRTINSENCPEEEELETFSPINTMKYGRAKRPISTVQPGEIVTSGIGFGQILKRMTREGWQAKRPQMRQNLYNPVSKMRFTHTGTPMCNTTEECMRSCREIQKYYMDLGFPDIIYNFMIGGDGVVYHGRGWLKQADRPPKFYNLKKSCIDVAYIGNFENEKVPFSMISTGMDFIKYSIKLGKLTPFYQAFTFAGEKHA